MNATKIDISALAPDVLLTDKHVSEVTGFSAATLRRWRMERKGPRFVLVDGRLPRYRAADVRAWINGEYVAA